MIDLLYLIHNRREFTLASIEALVRNTDWSLVSRLVIYDDASVDGAGDLATGPWPCPSEVRRGRWGGPVEVMKDFLSTPGAARFAKLDNDVIVPDAWLFACDFVMNERPELGLLGIEPPASRTRAPWVKTQPPSPESLDAGAIERGYAPCDAIGGIGMMRRGVFARTAMQQHATYGGFTDWQWSHPEIVKGWIAPPLDVFLLDRLPIEPWASLSREYIAKGWQRAWTNYDPAAAPLWSWWTESLACVEASGA